MEEVLTRDQQRFFDLIENTNTNFFIGGKPGVGKSVLIRALRERGQKQYTLAAPTGLAAINIGAKTLHSIFMIPVSDGIMAPDFNRYTTNPNVINNILYHVKHLIIDEVSMVRCDTLDYIDRLLRHIKQVNEPFGGIQVIVVGDFFQLPPIVYTADKKAMIVAGWESEYAFDAKCWNFEPLILTEVLRQKDDKFISILHSARVGKISNVQLQTLNKRVEPCTDFRIRLVAQNKQADAVNAQHLNAIKEKEYEFSADNYGTWPQFPVETVLKLKVGAQVLIKKNSADRPPKASGPFSSKLVNGTLAIVTEIVEADEDNAAHIVVKLRDGSTAKVYRARWERKEKEKIGDQWHERIIASFEQIPIQLAWAISMHKSQGQSLEFVHVDPSKVFAAGQLYVALSRARSLKGLSLENRATGQQFMTNRSVLSFMNKMEKRYLLETSTRRDYGTKK